VPVLQQKKIETAFLPHLPMTVNMGEEAGDPTQTLWCLKARETPPDNIIPNRIIILILKAFK